MKYAFLAIISLICLSAISCTFKEEYQVDEVLQIFKDMLKKNRDEQAAITTAHGLNLERLNNLIKVTKQQIAAKEVECAAIQDRIDDLNNEIQQRLDEINDLENESQANVDQIARLKKKSCQRNELFFKKIAQLYNQIKLYDYLRRVITETEAQDLQQQKLLFLQMKAALKHYSKKDIEGNDEKSDESRNYEKVYERTQEEIGTEHVDANKEQIGLDALTEQEILSLEQVKAELFDILDELTQNAKDDIEYLLELQVRENIEIIIIIIRLRARNRKIIIIIIRLKSEIVELRKKLAIAEEEHRVCQAELQALRDRLAELEAEKAAAIEQYNKQMAKKDKENALFERLIKLYVEKVASIEDEYKQNIDEQIEEANA